MRLTTASTTLILLMLISGCKSFYPVVGNYKLDTNQVLVTIVPVVNFSDRNIQGSASWVDTKDGRVCTIFLREYPYYLGHEIRHCFEGHWHSDRNGDDWD